MATLIDQNLVENYWTRDWNNIIRMLFKDELLKKLMLLPDGTNIKTFIEKYFIRAGYTNELLEHEDVRIVYSIIGEPTNMTPNSTYNTLVFDIYVKKDHLHDVTRDYLDERTVLIAKRLVSLLQDKRYNGGYRFYHPVENDKGTRTTGYQRYGLQLSFMKLY